MVRFSLALSVLFLSCVCAQAQTRGKLYPAGQPALSQPAARAILALKRLDQNVFVYRSLGEFEEGRKLASVSRKQFENAFQTVAVEVESALAELPSGKLRSDIVNSLNSYRDGIFWWRQSDPPRVISVSALAESQRTLSDTVFLSTVPYTVAIHWRQARKFLTRAENSLR